MISIENCFLDCLYCQYRLIEKNIFFWNRDKVIIFLSEGVSFSHGDVQYFLFVRVVFELLLCQGLMSVVNKCSLWTHYFSFFFYKQKYRLCMRHFCCSFKVFFKVKYFSISRKFNLHFCFTHLDVNSNKFSFL